MAYFNSKQIEIIGYVCENPREAINPRTLESQTSFMITTKWFKRTPGAAYPKDRQKVVAKGELAVFAFNELRESRGVVVRGEIDPGERAAKGGRRVYPVVFANEIVPLAIFEARQETEAAEAKT